MKPRRSPQGEAINAWLGQEIRLEGGHLHFEGCLRIDGSVVSGHLTGPSLVVGEGATVSGELEVERLTVYGTVQARARVDEQAWIAPEGSFRGELTMKTPHLTVEDGGTLEANVSVSESAVAATEASASPRS